MNQVSAIILAAGEGTRLNEGNPSPKPKVLFEVAEKPMLFYSLEVLRLLDVKDIVIVVGYLAEQVKVAAGSGYKYAYQEKAVGTGDAVKIGLEQIDEKASEVLVLYGADVYKKEIVDTLIELHQTSNSVISFLTALRADPTGYGRIVRNQKGSLEAIVEQKLATEEQKEITEVNDGGYIFKKVWLEKAIEKLQLTGANEYFLTDLVELAIQEGEKVEIYKIEGEGWYGVDTPEQIERTSQKIKETWETP